MILEKLSVANFRNLKEGTIEFDKGVNIICGENAQGKTNILEAVYMCATGRSHRTGTDKETIAFTENQAHLKINVDNKGYKDRIDVHLKKEKKGIAVNSVAIKSFSQMYGIIYAVIFSPEDLNIVKNGPSEARKFIDAEICQVKPVYYDNLKKYYKTLKQRNTLLKNIQTDRKLESTLFVWDEKLAEYGKYIIKTRKDFIKKLSDISSGIHKEISGGKENLSIQYKPSSSEENLSEMLKQSRERDIMLKSTNYGPHKDNILFFINGSDTRKYGSQGQQRCTALSLKISELKLIEDYKGKRPLLLLDDVLSELDGKRQEYLIKHIESGQTIITCTGVEDVLSNIKGTKIYTVKDGVVVNYYK